MNRKKFIQSEIENEPNNPLNYYLMAIEYRKLDDKEAMQKVLEFMLDRFSDYLPIYYLYAEHLYETDYIERATALAEKGIRQAQIVKNLKLENELKQLILLNS